jgi:hypothetical protein
MVAGAASAQFENNTVRVVGRVATFLQPALSGQVIVAIIYQPGDPASENEARAIERALGSGLTVGSLTLKPRRVAAGTIGDLAGARIAFVTNGVNYREIAAAMASRSILSIGSDPACTKAGFCVVQITSTPGVQITVSKAAAKAAKLRFSSGFLMLIREI